MCLPLQTRFVLDGDIVAEHEHVHIVVQRAVGLSCGIGARDGDDRQIRLRQQLQCRFPVGRLRIFRRGGLRPALLLEKLVGLLQDHVHQRLVAKLRDDDHIVRRRLHQLGRLQAALHKNVFIRGRSHHNGRLLHAIDRLYAVRQKHQRD